MKRRKPVRRRKPVPYVPPFEPCGSCVNGWLEGRSGAYRCLCWKAYVERYNTEAALKYSQAPEKVIA